MPTIEELFKSKKLSSGKTAEEQYDIRNTKSLQITPYNSLLGLPFNAVQKLRNNTNRFNESKIESEVTGLRVISTLSSPIIYGTDIIKFSTKTRNIVDDMKSGAKGVSNAGILGTFLNKAENLGTNLLSKIGVKLPQTMIPSRIVTNKDFGVVSSGNSAYGEGPGGEFATMVRLKNIKDASGGNFLGKALASNLQGRPTESQLIGSALDIGKKALSKLLLGSPSQAAQNQAKLGQTGYDSKFPYSRTVLPYKEEGSLFARNDLSSKYDIVFPQKQLVGYNPEGYVRPNVIKNKKSKFLQRNPAKLADSIEVKRGMYTKSDHLNKMVSYPSKDGLKNDLVTDTETQLDEYDFVTLKFWSVAKAAAINFRATISGLTETLSPSWDPNKFVGNPFSFYTYNGVERSVTFNFKVYSLSYQEHIAAWQRLNFLTSLVYPQGYRENIAVIPPFIKFTLGDMFRNKEAFIESLTYTTDDNTPWEVGLNDAAVKDWKLPSIVSVDVTLKLVENKYSTYQRRLYGYGGVDTNVDIDEDKNKELNRDGSPKLREAGQKQDIKKETKTTTSQPVENPSAEKVKPPEDPKGKFVTEYKGLKLYSTKRGPFETITSWKGDEKWHIGQENGAAGTQLLADTEKLYIDGRLENEGKKTA